MSCVYEDFFDKVFRVWDPVLKPKILLVKYFYDLNLVFTK